MYSGLSIIVTHKLCRNARILILDWYCCGISRSMFTPSQLFKNVIAYKNRFIQH